MRDIYAYVNTRVPPAAFGEQGGIFSSNLKILHENRQENIAVHSAKITFWRMEKCTTKLLEQWYQLW